jgi:hypothetical protein
LRARLHIGFSADRLGTSSTRATTQAMAAERRLSRRNYCSVARRERNRQMV